jgi:ribosome-associated toxin RatA of RatAB toxin-antitoxin module
MHRVDRSLLLPYSSAQMFALVRDVASYPQFLPWCPSTQVRVLSAPGEAEAAPGQDVIEARVEIGYLGVRSHFTTRNAHHAPDRIDLELLDGPFRRLHGHWHFRALGEQACKVSLVLEYGFAGGLLGRAIAPVFDKVANSLIDAFAARARALYGEGGFGEPLAAG